MGEERGNEASRPHLLWVLRDFVLELLDQSGSPISPDQYLEQALAAAPLAGHDQSRGQGARDVRQNLLKFFDRRGCTTLVQPVIDEAKLQNLQNLPYSELRPEFQRGVDALRMQLVQKCNSAPKAVGGQPLSCAGFVGLMKKMVESLNENKMVSVKGAWETVQHAACMTLTDELRNRASAVLRSLAKGEKLPSGAQLPLNEEALIQVFEKQRQEIKADFDRQAVGDEAVRREYWQELQDSIGRDETAVRQKNNSFADRNLGDALKAWQTWCAGQTHTMRDGNQIVENLSTLMERMPAGPLARTSRTALESAVRRLCAASTAINEAQASKQAEADREAAQEAEAQLRKTQAELREAREQVQKLAADISGYRTREHDLKSEGRLLGDRDAAMRADIDQARSEAAMHLAERAKLEEQVKLHAAEKRRLQDLVDQERQRNSGNQDQTGKERAALQEEVERTRQEHLRMLEEARTRADEDRRHHATSMEGEKNRLLEREREAGLLMGKVEALTAEKNLLHHQVSELQAQLRETETQKGRSHHEQESLKTDMDKLKKELDTKDEVTREEVSKRVELEKSLQEEQARKKACCVVQ